MASSPRKGARTTKAPTAGLVGVALAAGLGFAVACGDGNTAVGTPTAVETQTALPPSPTAPQPTPTAESVAAACSAATLTARLTEEEGLPAPVAEMRQAIAEAAVACDYDRLETLALAGQPPSREGQERFTYTFGGDEGQPGRFWRELEEGGEGVLASLVNVLNMPHAEEAGSYAWPFAFYLDWGNMTGEDREALERFFSEEEIADWDVFGGYIGYRAIITAEGHWIAFVVGD